MTYFLAAGATASLMVRSTGASEGAPSGRRSCTLGRHNAASWAPLLITLAVFRRFTCLCTAYSLNSLVPIHRLMPPARRSQSTVPRAGPVFNHPRRPVSAYQWPATSREWGNGILGISCTTSDSRSPHRQYRPIGNSWSHAWIPPHSEKSFRVPS